MVMSEGPASKDSYGFFLISKSYRNLPFSIARLDKQMVSNIDLSLYTCIYHVLCMYIYINNVYNIYIYRFVPQWGCTPVCSFFLGGTPYSSKPIYYTWHVSCSNIFTCLVYLFGFNLYLKRNLACLHWWHGHTYKHDSRTLQWSWFLWPENHKTCWYINPVATKQFSMSAMKCW